MKRDVNGCVTTICKAGTLVWRQRGIGVAQDQRRHSAAFQFLTKAPGQRYGHILFQQSAVKGFAAIIASMAGIHDSEITAGDLRPRRLRLWRIRYLRSR